MLTIETENKKILVKHWDGGKFYLGLTSDGKSVQIEKKEIKRSYYKLGFEKYLFSFEYDRINDLYKWNGKLVSRNFLELQYYLQ